MQFIDQSRAYARKAVTLDQALLEGRARLRAAPGSEAVLEASRPDRQVALAFDRAIHDRVDFDALSTPEKCDLMIGELLPGFFRPEDLDKTGRTLWRLSFTVDGFVTRHLELSAAGIAVVPSGTRAADIEIETDIVTLMAMLRAFIAQHHRRTRANGEAPGRVAALGPDDDSA